MKSKSIFSAVLALTFFAQACAPARVVAPTPITIPFSPTTREVIIDTDMAFDDWLGILYLLQRPDIKVLAITVVGTGEAHCAPGMRNALELIQLAGESGIPVACGRETPLEGGHEFPIEWRERVDDLAGLDLPASSESPQTRDAVELLTELISSSPENVTVLALGPLTNIAEALTASPALAGQIEVLYIMGGAVRAAGNVSFVVPENEVAEWNFYADPLAAQMVFESGTPITLIPLDATNDVPMTAGFYALLGSQRLNPVAEFAYAAMEQHYAAIESGQYSFWDTLAAAILADESLADFEEMRLSVVAAEGPTSGQTVIDPDGAVINVATYANRAYFENFFLQMLNTP
jgi:pyrimidine-specific ribonucleoside hydrolase